jgi:G3E family GTPase
MMELELFPSRAAGPFGRRLKHARGGRIPVTVLTGFLGAGKTTLLRNFLATPEGQGTAVIVNEYGAVGIDDALIRGSTDQTTLLGNGCVCCVTRSDLQNALRTLVIERDRGKVPPFVRIVIETSGMADPAPILQTFATDRALGAEAYIEVVATVVDTATGLNTIGWSSEARKQVILADRLILSKADLATQDDDDGLRARLRELNAHAEITVSKEGHIDPRILIEGTDAGDRSAFVAEAEHSDGIASFVVTEKLPLSWTAFARTMETLVAIRGSDLLRVKGFLDVAGCRGPVLVQFVQHLAHPPVELAAWPDGQHGSRVVFITRNISEAQVRGLLAAVHALEASTG